MRQSSAWTYRGSLRRFLNWLDHVAGTNLRDEAPRVIRATQRRVVCSDQEYQKLIAVSPPWFRFQLQACRLLALRNAEARNLTPENYNPDTQTISFSRKLGGQSNLPVPKEMLVAIAYAKEVASDKPIIETLGARNGSKRAIDYAWRKAKKEAGVTRNLNVHDLRRTAATRVYDQSKDLRMVQTLLGHNNLASTLAYIGHRTHEELRELLAQINAPEGRKQ